MQNKFIFIRAALLLGCFKCAYAAIDDQAALSGNDANSPPQEGNFALSAPQQPGPFLSFGQTLVDRNDVQIQYSDYTVVPQSSGGSNRNIAVTYGFSDTTDVYLNFPVESSYGVRVTRSSGLGDVLFQLEHAFYTAGNRKYQDQATVVGAITLPLQDASSLAKRNNPGQLVGYGAPVYFVGATYNRTYVDWLAFASPGVLLTTVADHIQLGSQVFYQAGLGRVIKSVSNKYIFSGLLEFEGQYTAKDKFFGDSLANTGGDIIFLSPSLWLSTQHLILQVGVSFPVVQHLNGNQAKSDYALAAGVTWTIT